MKNILQLFKKMQPKSYYGEGVAVTQTSWSKEKEDKIYTSNKAVFSSGCTVEGSADCQNVYSSKYAEMPVQGIGLIKAKKMR